MVVSGAVEGLVDEVVLRRIVHGVGSGAGPIHVKNGKDRLDRGIGGYNRAAQYSPWSVLRDLDHDAACPVSLREALLPDPAPRMCFRIAVRAVESWLLADRESIARFLGVSRGKVPSDPESLGDPKRALIDVARESSRRYVREGMVPRASSGRGVGPAYTARMIEFVEYRWRPEAAVESSESLRRCLNCLRELTKTES